MSRNSSTSFASVFHFILPDSKGKSCVYVCLAKLSFGISVKFTRKTNLVMFNFAWADDSSTLCVSPSTRPQLPLFWHFLALKSTLCCIFCSCRLKLMQTAPCYRYIKPLSITDVSVSHFIHLIQPQYIHIYSHRGYLSWFFSSGDETAGGSKNHFTHFSATICNHLDGTKSRYFKGHVGN